jgi:hypothetical protein
MWTRLRSTHQAHVGCIYSIFLQIGPIHSLSVPKTHPRFRPECVLMETEGASASA